MSIELMEWTGMSARWMLRLGHNHDPREQDMPSQILRTLLSILEETGTPLTRPGLANFLIIAVGWVQTFGVHAVTQALVVTGVAGERHHEAFHRFFSRGAWNPDDLGRCLFLRLERWLGDGAVRIAIDDTVASKKGPEVFGIGSHLDAVRSTKRRRSFCFGHCWVVLAVLVNVPFSSRVWALPVLLRLYRNKKECAAHDGDYQKKTELAREMIDVFTGWTDRRIEFAADSAYCNDTVTRGLCRRVVLFGAMRPDAVLTSLPSTTAVGSRRGRPRKRGNPLPKPECVAQDEQRPWQFAQLVLYGRKTTVRYKTLTAQWYRACGTRLLRIVVVATPQGAVPWRVFFCTDVSLSVPQILAGYGARWSIECFFREAKQFLGFGDSSARKKAAVLRVAPFVGILYSVLVIWFLEGASTSPLAMPPVRPWYTHKRGLSFEDILRAARRALANYDVLVPSRDINNLQQPAARAGNAERDPRSHARRAA